MSKGLTDTIKEQLLDNMLGDSSATPLNQATVYVGLSTTDPGSDGTGFTEPVGGAYARQASTNDATNWPDSSSGEKTNANVISYPAATSGWGTISHWGLFLAASGGTPVAWGELDTPRVVSSGDQFQHGIGKLVLTFANQ